MASEELDAELVQHAENLIDALGIRVPSKGKDNYGFLKTDAFYVAVFEALLAHSTHPLDRAQFDRETKACTPGERIQILINKLGSEVLNMDLNHIKGEKIAKGDLKNISDILQLLWALWQNYNNNPSDGEEEMFIDKMEHDLNDRDSFSQENELNDPSKRQQVAKGERQAPKELLYNQMVQDGGLAQTVKPAPGIPVYSDDPINYKDMVLEPKYGAKTKTAKATKNNPSSSSTAGVRNARPRTSGITSKKAEVVKRIESSIYGVRRDRSIKDRNLVKEVINI